MIFFPKVNINFHNILIYQLKTVYIMAKVKIQEREEFQYTFQITNFINFNVDFYTLSSNSHPDFSTSADLFYKNKTDYERCGQCQDEVLPKNSLAMEFYQKFDKYHLTNLTTEQYNEIVKEIEKLKERYNFICKKESEMPLNNFHFKFEDAVELSKLPLKYKNKQNLNEENNVKNEVYQLLEKENLNNKNKIHDKPLLK